VQVGFPGRGWIGVRWVRRHPGSGLLAERIEVGDVGEGTVYIVKATSACDELEEWRVEFR
jgi:hypothetical protein